MIVDFTRTFDITCWIRPQKWALTFFDDILTKLTWEFCGTSLVVCASFTRRSGGLMSIRTGLLAAAALAVVSFSSADIAFARRGADDPAGHVRQGRGADDTTPEVRGGNGADDPATHDVADDKGGAAAARNGADDPANHDVNDDKGGAVSGNGADDPANHDANDDRGRKGRR